MRRYVHNAFGLLLRAALFLGLLSSASGAHALRIWYESRLAHITAGYFQEDDEYFHRQFYLTVLGPEQLRDTGPGVIGHCAAIAGPKVSTQLRAALQSTLPWTTKFEREQAVKAAATDTSKLAPPELPLPAIGAAEQSAVDLKKIDAAFAAAIPVLRAELVRCAGPAFGGAVFRLGLVQRFCDNLSCGGQTPAFAGSLSASTFSLVGDWLVSRTTQDLLVQAGEVAVLPDRVSETVTPVVAARPVATAVRDACKAKPPGVASLRSWECIATELSTHRVGEALPWTEPPNPGIAQRQLEGLVTKVRQVNRESTPLIGQLESPTESVRIEHSVARAIALPRELAFRLVDALDTPARALGALPSVPDAKLLTLEDELARSRIAECARFKGKVALDAISSCAGYKLDQRILDSCMAGGACAPQMDKLAFASVLAQTATSTGKQLAEASLLPRLENLKLGEMEKSINECVRPGNSKSDSAGCLIEKELTGDAKIAFDCAKNKAVSELAPTDLECALKGRMTPDIKQAMDCANGPGNEQDKVRCIVESKMPKEVTALLSCQKQFGDTADQVAICVTQAQGGDGAKIAVCLSEHKDDVSGMAICVAQGRLSPEAAQALTCIQKGSELAAAACVADLKGVPDNIRKPLQCLAESNGEPFGAGVCMATDSLNLTGDQRIALQCLAGSGGEPITFATCAGGRLAMKELLLCVDKKLFEGNCMGENNEIRKLMKALGVNLSPDTVVGQVLNAPLDVVKFQVAVAQAALKGLQDFSGNVEREFNAFALNVGNTAADAGKVLNQAIVDGANAAAEVVRVAQEAARVVEDARKAAEQATKHAEEEARKILHQAEIDARNAIEAATRIRLPEIRLPSCCRF